ncbi:hypothetical protein GC089_08795 [Cellulomonas sp. JZ18]|uniref:hypothetical protein n=1 Tax=Cellulomonas sp. JZ18 TaxID=2654191 RepID=UPI0012D4BA28|nr:hypothetical protein [Cellulomonas sp. JZ18]QGQ19310.1 hypothetical protein GC089_08795 [Cellulomonas sp. JZ18]
MAHNRTRDLASDPAAQRLADRQPSDADLDGTDTRSGGDPTRGPRSLQASEREGGDEAISSSEDWDDPQRL